MEESNAPAEAAAAPVAVFKRRGAKKATIRKRPATPPPANSDSDSDFSTSEDEAGQRIKRRKKNTGTVTVTSKDHAASKHELSATTFSADRNASITDVNDATKANNWYDEDSKDATSSKNLLGTSRNASGKGAAPDGTYKGLANQTSFIEKKPDAPNRQVGPMKAPSNIRTITVMDFVTDTCKDFKQTGFCGFGDNCKFLHDRGDFKAGWQLDKEWEQVAKGKKNMGGTVVASADRSKPVNEEDDEDEAILENIPFACIICKDPYRAPVVTRCGHYFCEPCALARYRKNPTCAACGSSTNGVFNSASRLKKLLDRKREKAAKRRQEAVEAGEEVSDEDEE